MPDFEHRNTVNFGFLCDFCLRDSGRNVCFSRAARELRGSRPPRDHAVLGLGQHQEDQHVPQGPQEADPMKRNSRCAADDILRAVRV